MKRMEIEKYRIFQQLWRTVLVIASVVIFTFILYYKVWVLVPIGLVRFFAICILLETIEEQCGPEDLRDDWPHVIPMPGGAWLTK